MGIYYMLVSPELMEYVAMKHCRLANKSWVHVTHGLFVTWIMQHSHWYGKGCYLLSDAGTEDEYNDIYFDKAGWKDVEVEMINGYNDYMKGIGDTEHLITIEEKTLD